MQEMDAQDVFSLYILWGTAKKVGEKSASERFFKE